MNKISKLSQKKYRKLSGEFLVEGIKGVGEALKSNFLINKILVAESRCEEKDIKNLIKTVNTKSVQLNLIGQKEINQLKNTSTFPGVMAIVVKPKVNLEDLKGAIVCLDKINDPGNLGTIIRTCDWFGIKNIILSFGSVDPYNEKCVRSTMGSIFNVKIYESEDIVADVTKLKADNYKLKAMDMAGESVDKLKAENKDIYLFGSESHGISSDLKKMVDKVYTISGSKDKKVESLNVGIAVGIVLSKIGMMN